MDIVYKYWDLCTWGAGRALLWIIVAVVIMLIILWFIEQILTPIGEAIRESWWRWTSRCPRCGGGK